jgi:hypothetical protein
MDTQQRRPLTDRELRAWLATGQTDRGIGEGLTFVASASAASKGKASWILRFRVNGRPREKVLGRYPELSLKGAREAGEPCIARHTQHTHDGRSPVRGVDCGVLQALEQWQYLGKKAMAGVGHLNAPTGSMHEPCAEAVFQTLDGATHRRLGLAESGRRTSKALRFSDRMQCQQINDKRAVEVIHRPCVPVMPAMPRSP